MTAFVLLSSGFGETTTSVFDSTGADMLINAIAFDSFLNITDNKSNEANYLQAGSRDDAAAISLYYEESPNVGTGHTVSEKGFPHHSGVVGSAWSGHGTFSQFSYATSGNTQVTTINPGPITPTVAGQLAIVAIATRPDRVTSAFDVPGFTQIRTIQANGDNRYACSLWYLYNPTAGVALNPVCTWLGANSATAIISMFGPSNTGRSAIIGGTILGANSEDIVAGGKKIFILLAGDSFISTGFDSVRQGIINGLLSAGAEAAGFNAQVKPNIPVSAVERTGDGLVTITLPAIPGYVITSSETIEDTVPSNSTLGASGALVATPTITLTVSGASGVEELIAAGRIRLYGVYPESTTVGSITIRDAVETGVANSIKHVCAAGLLKGGKIFGPRGITLEHGLTVEFSNAADEVIIDYEYEPVYLTDR